MQVNKYQLRARFAHPTRVSMRSAVNPAASLTH
jgi:hypothetical protein